MSLWSERDFPVLRYLDQNPPEHEMLQTNWQSEKPHPDLPELSEQEFHYSVLTLADGGLVSYSNDEKDGGGGVMWMNFQVSGLGKQALGEWPMFEALGEPAAVADIIEKLAASAGTDEEEENLKNAADGVRKVGVEAFQKLVAGVIGAIVRAHTGF